MRRHGVTRWAAGLLTLDLDRDGRERRLESLLRLRPHRRQLIFTPLVRDPAIKTQPVEAIMQPAFPFVDITTPVDLLARMIAPENPAVLVRDFKSDKTFIITRSDVFRVLF